MLQRSKGEVGEEAVGGSLILVVLLCATFFLRFISERLSDDMGRDGEEFIM